VTRLTRDQSDLPVSPLSYRSDRGGINSAAIEVSQFVRLLEFKSPNLGDFYLLPVHGD
jgi:hypothetical protein